MRFSSSDGRVHIGEDSHFTGVKGTALVSGARTSNWTFRTQTNFTTDSDFAPSEFTAERTVNLTRLGEDKTFGDGDDLRTHVIAHGTVNASGVPTADRFEARTECR